MFVILRHKPPISLRMMLMKYGVWFSLFLMMLFVSCGRSSQEGGQAWALGETSSTLTDKRLLATGQDAAEKAQLLRLLAAQKWVGERLLPQYILVVAQIRTNEENLAWWDEFSFINPETFLQQWQDKVRLVTVTEPVLKIKSGVAFEGEDINDHRIRYLIKLFDIYQNNFYEYLACKNLWYNEAKDRWADDHLEVLLAQNKQDDEIYEVLLMEAYQEDDASAWLYSLYPREMLESFLNPTQTAFRREIKVDYRYPNGLFEVLDPANRGKAVHIYAHKISKAWWNQQRLHPQPLRPRVLPPALTL